MKEPDKEALAHRVCATKDDDPHWEGTVKAYREVDNYLLITCTTDDVIAEGEEQIANFHQPK